MPICPECHAETFLLRPCEPCRLSHKEYSRAVVLGLGFEPKPDGDLYPEPMPTTLDPPQWSLGDYVMDAAEVRTFQEAFAQAFFTRYDCDPSDVAIMPVFASTHHRDVTIYSVRSATMHLKGMSLTNRQRRIAQQVLISLSFPTIHRHKAGDWICLTEI